MPLDEIPQLDEVDEKLDALDDPTSLEVYEAMLPYDNDMVAAAGIQRALSGGGGGGGVTSVEGLTGVVTLSEGNGIDLTVAGNDIEVASSAVSPYKSGMYWEHPMAGTFGAGAMTQNSLVAVPVWIWGPIPVTFTSMSISITTGAGGSTVRAGWYGQAATGGPGARLSDLGTVDGASNAIVTWTTDFTIGPGLVWLAMVAQGGTPGVRRLSVISDGGYTNTGIMGLYLVSSSGLSNGFNGMAIKADAAASGALPDPFGAYTGNSQDQFPRYEMLVA